MGAEGFAVAGGIFRSVSLASPELKGGMSTSQYVVWKEDGSTLTWDHFQWDTLAVLLTQMKPLKIPINNKSDALILPLADSMVAGAAGKTELEDGPVSLAELTTMRNEASAALTTEIQAKEAWHTKRTNRRDLFKVLRIGMRRYAIHAHNVYAGDKMQLQALGLDIVEITGTIGVPNAPQNLRSRPGLLAGTVELRWRTVRGRDFYVLECAENAAGPWEEVYTGNDAFAVCEDLEGGKEYFFRVLAEGSVGPGPWSDITKSRAA
jgi:hypothetical protein